MYIFRWLIPFSVGRSCQKESRTVDRSPPGSLQRASGKAERALFSELPERSGLGGSDVQRSGDARGDFLIVCPLTKFLY